MFKKLFMKYSLTLIELLTVVVFIGILLLINMPVRETESNLLAQEQKVEKKNFMCRKI